MASNCKNAVYLFPFHHMLVHKHLLLYLFFSSPSSTIITLLLPNRDVLDLAWNMFFISSINPLSKFFLRAVSFYRFSQHYLICFNGFLLSLQTNYARVQTSCFLCLNSANFRLLIKNRFYHYMENCSFLYSGIPVTYIPSIIFYSSIYASTQNSIFSFSDCYF